VISGCNMHSRVNCAEMAGDRPRQPAYEIFSIECRFQKFKSGPFRFKEACTRGCQRGVPLLKVIIYPLLACLTWKWLQIGTDMLLNITSTSNELLRIVNIDDIDWPWTLKIGVLVIFWRFLAAKEWIVMKWMEIDQDYLQTWTAMGSRTSHEH